VKRRNIYIVIGVVVLLLYVWRRWGTVTTGAPIVKGKAGGASSCRAGEIYRGGFCATEEYWRELDAS
jgi:hypothetical protein